MYRGVGLPLKITLQPDSVCSELSPVLPFSNPSFSNLPSLSGFSGLPELPSSSSRERSRVTAEAVAAYDYNANFYDDTQPPSSPSSVNCNAAGTQIAFQDPWTNAPVAPSNSEGPTLPTLPTLPSRVALVRELHERHRRLVTMAGATKRSRKEARASALEPPDEHMDGHVEGHVEALQFPTVTETDSSDSADIFSLYTSPGVTQTKMYQNVAYSYVRASPPHPAPCDRQTGRSLLLRGSPFVLCRRVPHTTHWCVCVRARR